MTSAIEITKKIVAASVFNKADIGKIIINYMSELLMDMVQIYSMTNTTKYIVAAAFKLQADMLYSRLDDEGKRACDNLIKNADFSVQQVSVPIKFKVDKSDSAGGH